MQDAVCDPTTRLQVPRGASRKRRENDKGEKREQPERSQRSVQASERLRNKTMEEQECSVTTVMDVRGRTAELFQQLHSILVQHV